MLRSNFKYNGKSLSDFQMKMYDPDTDPHSVPRIIDKAPQNSEREVPNHYTTYRNEVLTHNFLIIKDPEFYGSSNNLRLTDKDIHILKSWLFSTTTPTELILPMDDEEIEVSYFGVFTDVQYYIPVQKSCYGLQLTFTCNAPYGFSPLTSKRYYINSTSVNGDYLNNAVQFAKMTPPKIIIQAAVGNTFSGETLTITNHKDSNRHMTIKLPDGLDRVTIDCQTKVAMGRVTDGNTVTEQPLTMSDLGLELFAVDTDNTRSFQLLNLYGNLYWLNLLHGSNALEFTTLVPSGATFQEYTVEIQTRYIIEAGGF